MDQTSRGVSIDVWSFVPCNHFHQSQRVPILIGRWTASTQRFSNQWPLKALNNTASHSPVHPHIHPFILTFTHWRRSQPRRATASWSGAVRVRRLAQGHLDTQLGGAGWHALCLQWLYRNGEAHTAIGHVL